MLLLMVIGYCEIFSFIFGIRPETCGPIIYQFSLIPFRVFGARSKGTHYKTMQYFGFFIVGSLRKLEILKRI